MRLHVQGGKITFVYIASPEEDGDDLETGGSWAPRAEGLICLQATWQHLQMLRQTTVGALTLNADMLLYGWSIHSSQMNSQWRVGALAVRYRLHGYQRCLWGCR